MLRVLLGTLARFRFRAREHHDPVGPPRTAERRRGCSMQERHLPDGAARERPLQGANRGGIVLVECLPMHYIHQRKTAGCSRRGRWSRRWAERGSRQEHPAQGGW